MNRELDATIAKEIFNWVYIPVSSDANGENQCSILFPPNKTATQDMYNQLPRIGAIHEAYLCPPYSSDLVEAIRLAKHVRLPMSINDMPEQAEQLACAALHHYRKLELIRKDLETTTRKASSAQEPNHTSDNTDNAPTKPR
jgi:hypothetical protein